MYKSFELPNTENFNTFLKQIEISDLKINGFSHIPLQEPQNESKIFINCYEESLKWKAFENKVREILKANQHPSNDSIARATIALYIFQNNAAERHTTALNTFLASKVTINVSQTYLLPFNFPEAWAEFTIGDFDFCELDSQKFNYELQKYNSKPPNMSQ
jgi:hypothetical protein